MANLRTFLFAYTTQLAFLGGNAQPNGSGLADLVPKREVMYVGGQYTNITASFPFHQSSTRAYAAFLRLGGGNRTMLSSIPGQRLS